MKSQGGIIFFIPADTATSSKFFHTTNLSLPASGLLKMIGLVDAIFASGRTITCLSAPKRVITNYAGYDFIHNLIITQNE